MPNAIMAIWKIEESLEQLLQIAQLSTHCHQRFQKIQTKNHQKEFVAVRCILTALEIPTTALKYLPIGKPYLSDGREISISHSNDYATVIIADTLVGIDIQKITDKVLKIKDKYIHTDEQKWGNDIQTLTCIWTIKEAVYKYYSLGGLSLKQHIKVIEMTQKQNVIEIKINKKIETAFVQSFEVEDYICSYIL